MTDRPPSLILKPLAHTMTHGVKDPVPMSSGRIAISSTATTTVSAAATTATATTTTTDCSAPLIKSQPFTEEQTEENALRLQLLTLHFVEEELLVSRNKIWHLLQIRYFFLYE